MRVGIQILRPLILPLSTFIEFASAASVATAIVRSVPGPSVLVPIYITIISNKIDSGCRPSVPFIVVPTPSLLSLEIFECLGCHFFYIKY